MEPAVARLFEQYFFLVATRLAEKRLPRVGYARVIGAIVTKYLLAHREEIMNAYAQVRIESSMGAALPILKDDGLPVVPTLTTTSTRTSEAEDPRGDGSPGSSR